MANKEKQRLTHRDRMFVDWYIKLGNITEAAIKAGFSPRSAHVTGSRTLKKAKIQAYYKLRLTQLEEVLGFNKGTIIQDLHDIKSRSMQAVPVMYYSPKERQYVQKKEQNEQGEEVGVYQFDGANANRAIENIAKMMGYNEPDKIEHSQDPGRPIFYIPENGRGKADH